LRSTPEIRLRCPHGRADGAFAHHEGLEVSNPTFADFGLSPSILSSLEAAGFTTPTPIQAQAIPAVRDGHDLMGLAQTGTGKTGAFALPIIHRLAEARERAEARAPRALILVPTRELAVQIGADLDRFARPSGLRHAVVFGGVSQNPQAAALARGVDMLVATPGRLIDLLNQRLVRLDRAGILVLDEADRMLDMGFIRDVRRIVALLPSKRQSLLFSATMPREVEHLAAEILREPKRVQIAAERFDIERIDQRVYHVDAMRKRALLETLLDDPALSRVIVFTRTKHGANKVALQLERLGVATAAIHGNKSQNARQRALDDFKAGHARVLVATDVAARGIDVREVTHVLNYEMPNQPESYVHRIGRTARAGHRGIAISFCDGSERSYLTQIERLTGRKIAPQQLPTLKVSAAPPAEPRPQAHPHGHGPKPHRGGGRPEQAARPDHRGRNDHGGRPARAADGEQTARPDGQRKRPHWRKRSAKPAGRTGGGGNRPAQSARSA